MRPRRPGRPPPPVGADPAALPRLTVSHASAAFLARGHPWVRVDRWTRGLDALRAGERVRLADPAGLPLAEALADPEAAVCARVVPAGWEPRRAAREAWARRAALHADPATDCYRLVHGEGDALPGLRIDRYGPLLVATVLARCIRPHLDAVLAELADRLSPALVVVHEHYDDLRRAPPASWRWPEGGAVPEVEIEGRELGVRYRLRPASGLNPGLYVDQRATRAWLMPQAAGRRLLNLFSFTGAFSLALLAAGATEAWDVDLAQPALRRAAEQAALNGVAERHRTCRAEARAFCAAAGERFDLIVIDPPTAAQGAGGWVARRDYPELLRLAWRLLAPGGVLVAISNTLGRALPLARLLAASCPGSEPLPGPPLGDDLPQLPGFPEGRPFVLAAVRRPADAVAR